MSLLNYMAVYPIEILKCAMQLRRHPVKEAEITVVFLAVSLD
jgi:hypothetical protein